MELVQSESAGEGCTMRLRLGTCVPGGVVTLAVGLAALAAFAAPAASVALAADNQNAPAGGQAPTGGGPSGQKELPFFPIAGNQLLIYPATPYDLDYALRAGAGRGTGLGATVAPGLAPGVALYDPVNGYFYYPGVVPNVVIVTVGPLGGPQTTYYVNPGAAGPLAPQMYLPLAGQLSSLAEQPPAPAEQEEAAAKPEPARPSGFGSSLSPMLRGPDTVPLEFALGEAMLREGKYDEAAKAFQRAVTAAPGEPAPRVALSVALVAAGRFSEAARALRVGLSAASDWARIRLSPATSFGSAEAFGAVERKLQEAAQNDPSNNDLHLLLGFLHFATGREAEAVALLSPISEANPQDLVMKGLVQAAQSREGAKGRKGASSRPAAEATGEGATKKPQ